MGAVCGRHVFDDGRIAARAVIAGVARDTATTMQEFDSASGDARIELESDQSVRHAVAVFVDLDVVVNVNGHRLEARQFIGLGWQRLQCRRVQFCECACATSRQLLERALV